MSDAQSSVTSVADFGTDEAAKARRWISELDLSIKDQKGWGARVQKIIRRYKNERKATDPRRMALLWSNLQILGPAVYARTPHAVVSRRFKDDDPVGLVTSEILERAVNYALDSYDLDAVMRLSRDDYLLLARGQAWVRYEPHFKTVTPKIPLIARPKTADSPEVQSDGPEISQSAEIEHVDGEGRVHDPDKVQTDEQGQPIIEGEPYEAIDCEEVCVDHLNWDDFGTNPCRSWDEVRFVWRRAYLTREELTERFTAKVPGGSSKGQTIGEVVPLDYGPDPEKPEGDKDGQFRKAAVYEIWDKASETVFWISKSWPVAPLDERPDPLELEGFFPCPRPLLGTCGPDSLIPVPDYVYWQDQAEEVDELTERIGKLLKALKVTGFYAGEMDVKLQNLFSSGNENMLIPVDSFAALKDQGGIRGVIDWFPLEQVVAALKACIDTRTQIIEDIYQITGISDILRGSSDPSETATAAGIKASWGSIRVKDKQKELARFARDILRLQGQVIAGKFTVETLKAMTGVKLFDDDQHKQQALEAFQAQASLQAQGPMVQGAPPPPAPGQPPLPAPAPPPPAPPEEMQRLLSAPTWADVSALLTNRPMRQFRIEIETDATIEPDEQQEKARRVEFVQAMGQLIGSALPAVQAAPKLMPLVAESMKFLARGFRVSREMEDIIDKVSTDIASMPPPPPPQQPQEDPTKAMTAQAGLQAAQARLQETQVRAQAEDTRSQTELMLAQHEAQMAEGDQQLARTDQALKAAELEMRRQGLAQPATAFGGPQ